MAGSAFFHEEIFLSGVRVYELARELGVANKVLLDLLNGMGYPVKSHSSSIDMHLGDRLRRQVKKMGLEAKSMKKTAKASAKKPAAATAPKKAKATTVKSATAKKKTQPVKKAPAPTGKPTTKKPASAKGKGVKKAVPPVAKAKRSPISSEAAKATSPVASSPKTSDAKPTITPAKPHPRRKEQRPFTGSGKTGPTLDKKPPRITRGVSHVPRTKKTAQQAKEAREKRKLEESERRLAEKRKREEAAIARAQKEKQRKIEAEERELQRLIDEEERAKQEAEARRIVIDEATTVKEFADKLRVGVNEIITKLITKGIMATLNQTIDADVARELALEMGYEIKTKEENELEEEITEDEDEESLAARPPVVTIMGHVDHGKTSLLDTIRKTRVTEEEAGGITQRIGAYAVKLDKGTVVFIDTPGHEAFTAMRSRGASVTDIVVLVVAADDGVMPQTLEAIHHASAAQVPVLVAINKIDKPGANPDRIKQDMATHNLVPEEWGGKTIFCEVSAKENVGIDALLEMILLQSEILELKANPKRMAYGTVIESKLDKGRGPVATVLVQKGTLKIGDSFVSGMYYGKVRAIIDDRGKRIESAGPSMPAEILGFSGVPTAGESFMVVESERKAHQIALKREESLRLEGLTAKDHVKLENLHAQITKGEVTDLNIIIKADVQGSIEAVRKAFDDIRVESVRVNVLHGAVGGITETDIGLAAASNAIVIGFNVRPTEKANKLAEDEEVDVRLYSVIYNAIDDIKLALEGMLAPVFKEVVTGRAEVRQTFNISKVGAIAGSHVLSGKITRNSEARLIRDNVVVHTGKISSLKRFKGDVKEVTSGYDCGIGLEKYNDVKPNDIVESFVLEEIVRSS